MMGHIARDCRTKGNGKGKGRDGGKEYSEGKGRMVKGAGKKGSGQSGGLKGEQKDWGYQGQCWTCGKIGHKSVKCPWEVGNVDEDDVDSRKSGGRSESEKDDEVGGVWIVGNVEELEDEEMIRREVGGADPSTGHKFAKTNAMDSVEMMRNSMGCSRKSSCKLVRWVQYRRWRPGRRVQ